MGKSTNLNWCRISIATELPLDKISLQYYQDDIRDLIFTYKNAIYTTHMYT